MTESSRGLVVALTQGARLCSTAAKFTCFQDFRESPDHKSRTRGLLCYLACMNLSRFRTTLLVLLLAIPAFAKDEKFSKAGPVQLTPDGNKWAEKTLKKMPLEEKIGQMIQVRTFADFMNVDSDAYRAIRDQITKYHLGSILLTVRIVDGGLVKDLPYEAAAITNLLQKESKLPLLVAADFERGLSMRLNETAGFPAAMAFGATFKDR